MLDGPDHPTGGGGEPPRPLETTAILIIRARSGDERAITDLMRRFTPALRRAAHGKLAGRARARLVTEDLVQIAFTKAFNKMNGFEPRGPGAFLAYLRTIVRNLVATEYRWADGKPEFSVLDPDMVDGAATPLDGVLGSEFEARYRAALGRLDEDQQIAVALHVEWGASAAVIMEALGKRTRNAARMVLSRGLVNLAKEMGLKNGKNGKNGEK